MFVRTVGRVTTEVGLAHLNAMGIVQVGRLPGTFRTLFSCIHHEYNNTLGLEPKAIGVGEVFKVEDGDKLHIYSGRNFPHPAAELQPEDQQELPYQGLEWVVTGSSPAFAELRVDRRPVPRFTIEVRPD